MKIERLPILLFMSENRYQHNHRWKRPHVDYFDSPTGSRFDIFYGENDRLDYAVLSSGSYFFGTGDTTIRDPEEKKLIDKLVEFLQAQGYLE